MAITPVVSSTRVDIHVAKHIGVSRFHYELSSGDIPTFPYSGTQVRGPRESTAFGVPRNDRQRIGVQVGRGAHASLSPSQPQHLQRRSEPHSAS